MIAAAAKVVTFSILPGSDEVVLSRWWNFGGEGELFFSGAVLSIDASPGELFVWYSGVRIRRTNEGVDGFGGGVGDIVLVAEGGRGL